jgi:hypothetical protein
MPLSPDLFDSITPPHIWVTLAALERPESDSRSLTVRFKEEGKRSISATVQITRYAPEETCLLAVSKMISRLQTLQVPLDRVVLEEELRAAAVTWVEPF